MPRRNDDSDLDPEPRRRWRQPARQSDDKTVLILVGVGFALLFAACAAVGAYVLLRDKPANLNLAGGPAGSDLERLAGAWECTFRDPAGRVFMHKVKEITDTTETATWYRPDGSVFRVNRVQFELVQRGPEKVFRYFNGWVVDG